MSQPISNIEELPCITLGKGVSLHIFIDHFQSKTSLDYCWTETRYDGHADSLVFEVPSHWHKYHNEHLSVLSGEADFTINDQTIRLRAGDPPIIAQRGTVHAIKCVKGVPSVVKERTDPTGDFKQWFFREIFMSGDFPPFLQTMRIFYDHDVYIPLPVPVFGGSRLLDQVFMTVVGGFAKLVSPRGKTLKELLKR